MHSVVSEKVGASRAVLMAVEDNEVTQRLIARARAELLNVYDRHVTDLTRIDETGELVPVDVEEVVAHEGAAVVIRAGGGRVGESFALDHDRMTIGRPARRENQYMTVAPIHDPTAPATVAAVRPSPLPTVLPSTPPSMGPKMNPSPKAAPTSPKLLARPSAELMSEA